MSGEILTGMETTILFKCHIRRRNNGMDTNCRRDVMCMVVVCREKKGGMKKDAVCNAGFEMPTSEIAAFHLHRYSCTCLVS